MDKTITWVVGLFFALSTFGFGYAVGGWFSWVLYTLGVLLLAGLVVMLVRWNKT